MIRLGTGAGGGDPEAEIMEQEQPTRSRGGRPRIAQNSWGNWNGYRGRVKVIQFTNSPYFSQEEAARLWLGMALKVYPGETLNAVK